MAYRFNGSTDYVEFGIAPFSGYTFGAQTVAVLLKRGNLSAQQFITVFTDSGLSATRTATMMSFGSNEPDLSLGSILGAASATLTSTSLWYIVVATYSGSSSGGGTQPRFHIWDGTSWTHLGSQTGTAFTPTAVVGTDRLRVGTRSGTSMLNADVVCIGIKKTDTADLAVEALNATQFSTWASFGFDWLVKFDASSTRTNVTTPGSGDETARSGTTLVADPAGWSYAVAAAPKGNFLALMA